MPAIATILQAIQLCLPIIDQIAMYLHTGKAPEIPSVLVSRIVLDAQKARLNVK
jgi:hypothetical protein